MSNKTLRLEKYLTVGVFRCVLDNTISRKSLAVGTGAIALRPLVAMPIDWLYWLVSVGLVKDVPLKFLCASARGVRTKPTIPCRRQLLL
jgi:hypothetical protein